jgi:glutathione synthase/RimK-type ligase-like ATP-grasp enzyme
MRLFDNVYTGKETTMRRIAFANYSQLPTINTDEQPSADVLKAHGIQVEAVIWNDPNVVWETFDAVILRATWDYFTQLDRFLAWIDSLEQKGIRLLNPPNIVRWNAHKTYLRDLAAQGVPTIPTVWLDCGTQANLAQELQRQNWSTAIIKPTVSGGAFQTWITTDDPVADQQKFEALLAQSDVMIQPFIKEIQTSGEWSLLFLGGEFSHAVVKRPQRGDFRVQREYGGSFTSEKPSAALIEQASRIIDAVDSPLLYARVDGIEVDGTLTLMELELIEPFLFLGSDPQAQRRFAEAILASLP